jgi:hypothetical protein
MKDKHIKKLEKLIKDKKPVSDKLIWKLLRQTVPSRLLRTKKEIKQIRKEMNER